MVSIEPVKDSHLFDPPLFGKVHAPVYILVGSVVQSDCAESHNRKEYGSTEIRTGNHERKSCNDSQYYSVPPGHWNGLLILLVYEMVGVIGFENPVVDHGVRFESVVEGANRLVHDEPM